jgi:hypothetical protein
LRRPGSHQRNDTKMSGWVISGCPGISTIAHWWAVKNVNNLENRAECGTGTAKRAWTARLAQRCGLAHGVSDAQPPKLAGHAARRALPARIQACGAAQAGTGSRDQTKQYEKCIPAPSGYRARGSNGCKNIGSVGARLSNSMGMGRPRLHDSVDRSSVRSEKGE